MTILLIVYKVFFESEKMHTFNRVFLLGSIIFSMLVYFLPTGFEMSPVLMAESTTINQVNLVSDNLTVEQSTESNSSRLPLIIAYLTGLVFLAFRYIRNIIQLLRKVNLNSTITYQEATLVLLNENISPFTFLHYIFVNKASYESGNIDERLLAHELTHVRQRHSLDVLFIEAIRMVFWFNPVLWIYKRAIQLNHEFLADEAVLSDHPQVFDYQSLLLDTIINNKVFLASNINFQLTKKRLAMMTKKSSNTRKQILSLGLIPICIFLMLTFGRSLNAQSETAKDNATDQKDRYFENTVVHYKTSEGLTKVISYKSLDAEMRNRIPLPPPPPPVHESTVNTKSSAANSMIPLPKGTVVYLLEDGMVRINDGKGGINPPPPPPPPAPTMMPPPPPVADMQSPPPPPPPMSVEQIFAEGGTAYIDGQKATQEQIEALMNQSDLLQEQNKLIERIEVKQKDGKHELHIYRKQ